MDPASPSSSPAASPATPPSQSPPASSSSANSPASPAAAAPSPDPATPAAAARPDGLPENFWDATANKFKAETFNEIIARDAAEQSRRLTLPQNADAYKVELPGDFTPPQGMDFKFKDGDPLLAQARGVYHDIQMGKLSGQEGFSKLLGLYAGAQIASEQLIAAGKNAELAKLGPTATPRVDALTNFYTAHLGEAEAKAVMSGVFTAAAVQAHEKLIARFASQGAGSFSGGRREADTGAKLSAEQYDKLSYSEKKEYAARHSGTAH